MNEISHLSYSQLSTYRKCGRSWYLSKIVRAQERPAWYTAIGSAVHVMVEGHLAGHQNLEAERFFYPLVERQLALEPDTEQWMFSLDDKGVPLVKERALEHVKVCFERAIEFLEDIDVWEVEYDASGRLPGCDVPVKAFVDIIGEHKKKKKPVGVDWKTGKSKDQFQMDTYKALVMGTQMDFDLSYFMMLAPWAPQSRYKDLSAVDPAEVGKKYQDVYLGMRAKLYPATHVEQVCGFCFHAPNCLERSPGTERAIFYDRSSEVGFPF